MRHLLIEEGNTNVFSWGTLTAFQRNQRNQREDTKHITKVGPKALENHMNNLSGWDKVNPDNINPHIQGH